MATSNAPKIPPFRPRARTHFWNYPRPYRTGWKAWLPSWRFIVGVMLAGTSLVAGVLIAAWTSISIEGEVATASLETSTVKYAGDGGTLGEFKAEEDRKIVTVDELPKWVANAPVASEERDFYAKNNLGISPKGILRSLINGKGGGSTLTQQYVEQYHMGWNSSPTYADKFTEMIMAMKVRQSGEYPPDKILGDYLNVINLGRSSFGIQSAALSYYGKDAKDLSPSEAAFLAGIIPSPNTYDNSEAGADWAKRRWGRTLDLMHEDGYIDDAQYEEAAAAGFPEPKEYESSSMYSGPEGYILKEVERELLDQDIDPRSLFQDGLEVHTTIDKKLQDAANEAAKLPENANTPLTRSALVSMDPTTGAIRAMYGGPDKSDPAYELNAATDNWQQGGSTNKPFALLAAMEEGIPLGKEYNGDQPQTFDYYTKPVPDTDEEEPVEVTNFGYQSFGDIDLVKATAHSVNTVYVQLNHEVGPSKTQDVARRLGLEVEGSIAAQNGQSETSSRVSNVLGTSYVYTVDLARAYATIANKGVRTTPYLVDKVVDPDSGEVLYQAKPDSERMFDEKDIGNTTYAMSQVVDDPSGSGHYARQFMPDRPLAGKTGTANDNMAAWFAGFTPQLVTVVNVYEYDPNARDGKGKFYEISPFGEFDHITGGTWPVQAWTQFMTKATEGMPMEPFPDYEVVVPTPSAPPVEMVTVPTNLGGASWDQAKAQLESLGLKPQAKETEGRNGWDPGTVIQVSGAGSEVEVGSTVEVEITALAPETATVPGVVGSQQRDAQNALRAAGFRVQIETQISAQPQGLVLNQDPGPGAEADAGSTVTIWVSDGSLSGDPSDGATCGVWGRSPCDNEPDPEPSPEPTADEPTLEPVPGGGNEGGSEPGGGDNNDGAGNG